MLTLADLDKFREDIQDRSWEDLAALRRTLNNAWDRKEYSVAAGLNPGLLVEYKDSQGLAQLGVIQSIIGRLICVKDHDGNNHNFVSSRLIQVVQ